MVKKEQTLKISRKAFQSLADVNKILRDRFKALREDGTITMDGLIAKTDLGESNLYRWIRGQHELENWVVIKKMALVLGIKITVHKA